ncbi:hypothetical protein [Yersinia mollaretii]|uniref:hypothetical protein n=1 Tax=Yersinia mollaretii TaxID=33060 RepID=UPI0005E9086C|nr:hypothetical protein [Yersinia mollaretii]CQH44012.1 Uncharacterised protein [Yersinia mollaretii]
MKKAVVDKFDNTSLRLFHSRIHKDRNGEKLFIQPNGCICKKLTSVSNEENKHLKSYEINRINIELNEILHEKGVHLKDNVFTEVVYRKNKEDITGVTYYLSKNYSPFYKPNIPYVHLENEQGGSKYVVSNDDNFVALATTKKGFSTENNFHDLNGLNSIKIGLVVAEKLMISQNAGTCLTDHLKNNPPLPQSVFENAVNDLKQLHKRQTFLRDIKKGNMAYDGKQVNFIDIDDRISLKRKTLFSAPTFNIYGKEVIYTPEYMTEGLLRNIYKHSSIKPGKLILRETTKTYSHRVSDEYAFLMTMISSTTKENNLKSSINNAKTDAMGIEILDIIRNKITNCNDVKELKHLNEWYNKTKNEYIYPGVMNKENGKYFTPWLEANIKPEHHKSVRSLLTDPARYADTSPKTHLADMLLFK